MAKNCAGANGACSVCRRRQRRSPLSAAREGEAPRPCHRRAAEDVDVAPGVRAAPRPAVTASRPERVEHQRRCRAPACAAPRRGVRLAGACGAPALRVAQRAAELASTSTAGGGGGGSPSTSVLSKRTEKSHQKISNVALPLTRSGRGPSSEPSTDTLNRLCEPCLSCTEAWKSAMKCSGAREISTSKPTSPSTLKP